MNLSFKKKLLYALGQFGLVLSAYGIGKLFVSFFVNRSLYGGMDDFPVVLYPGYIFGFFTVAGLIIAVSRLVDVISGLFFGFASDRNPMRKGRRTGFMVIAAAPLSILSVLIFLPSSPASYLVNSIIVLSCAVFFYIFLSMYTIPYLALLAELGATTRDRMQVSTLIACATAVASLLGNRVFFFMDVLDARFRLSPLVSFRIIVAVYALIAFVCMQVPARFLDEKKYSTDEPVRKPFGESIRTVLGDSYFRHYLIADFMYRLASAFALTGFSWYVTMLLGLSSRDAAFFLLMIFFANILFLVPVSILARAYGKRKILFSGFLMFMVFLVVASFAGQYALNPFTQGLLLSLLAAIPVSVFTVIPNALVADLAVVTERKTGEQRAGMYFGVFSLTEKCAQMIATLVVPSLIVVGATAGTGAGRIGLRVTIIAAAVFSFVGFLFLFGYREREVSAIFEKED